MGSCAIAAHQSARCLSGPSHPSWENPQSMPAMPSLVTSACHQLLLHLLPHACSGAVPLCPADAARGIATMPAQVARKQDSRSMEPPAACMSRHLASPSCRVASPTVVPLGTHPSSCGCHGTTSGPTLTQTPSCGQGHAASRLLHAAAASPPRL
jgi:hypothetical protein